MVRAKSSTVGLLCLTKTRRSKRTATFTNRQKDSESSPQLAILGYTTVFEKATEWLASNSYTITKVTLVMSLKQKKNRRLATKSNKKTGTAGPRANKRARLRHGTGKGASKSNAKKGRS